MVATQPQLKPTPPFHIHRPGHIGKLCRQKCLTNLEANARVGGDVPFDVCDAMNSLFSGLGHTLIHHMNKFLCQLVLQGCIDVRNLSRLLHASQSPRAAAQHSSFIVVLLFLVSFFWARCRPSFLRSFPTSKPRPQRLSAEQACSQDPSIFLRFLLGFLDWLQSGVQAG